MRRPCARPSPRPRPASARFVGTARPSDPASWIAGDGVVERAGRALRSVGRRPRRAGHAGARLGQRDGDGGADAAGRAGDQRDLAVEVVGAVIASGSGEGGDAGERAQDVVEVGAGGGALEARRPPCDRRSATGSPDHAAGAGQGARGTPATAGCGRSASRRRARRASAGRRCAASVYSWSTSSHAVARRGGCPGSGRRARGGRRRRGRGAGGAGSTAAPSASSVVPRQRVVRVGAGPGPAARAGSGRCRCRPWRRASCRRRSHPAQRSVMPSADSAGRSQSSPSSRVEP